MDKQTADKLAQGGNILSEPTTAIPCQECKNNGRDRLQERDGGLFKCTKYPTRHVTKVGPEHN